MLLRCLIGPALVCALSACATAPSTADMAFSGLNDTSWRLAEIQSSDDARGSRRPADPENYSIRFNADGTVAARLDCNRASGTWQSKIANATGGTLTFGPLAVTKALCPDPTMGEILEQQLPWVRSFTIRDGNLNMALMADGGIIVWKPEPKQD